MQQTRLNCFLGNFDYKKLLYFFGPFWNHLQVKENCTEDILCCLHDNVSAKILLQTANLISLSVQHTQQIFWSTPEKQATAVFAAWLIVLSCPKAVRNGLEKRKILLRELMEDGGSSILPNTTTHNLVSRLKACICIEEWFDCDCYSTEIRILMVMKAATILRR